MWVYKVSTGDLSHDNVFVAIGYSGRYDGKNNPALQNIHDVGPIPVGIWKMQVPINSDHMGPFVIPLFPVKGTVTYGRSGFFCHGESTSHPGLASHGCIVQGRFVRDMMWGKGDHDLTVIA